MFHNQCRFTPTPFLDIFWFPPHPCGGRAPGAPTDDLPNLEQFGKPLAHSIPTIIRSYKSAVTKRINELRAAPSTPVWQRNYYEHIITTDREYELIVEYIDANPRAWPTDAEAPQTAR
jgi:hypothetical protein